MNQTPEKEEEPCHHIGKDMKLSYYEIQDTYRNFNRGTEVLNGRNLPLWGYLCTKIFFKKCSERQTLYISNDIGLWAISVPN